MKPYIEIGNGVVVIGDEKDGMTVAMDEISYGEPCNGKNLKDFLGGDDTSSEVMDKDWKAPDSCVAARNNFKKNFVDNVAYRKDNTMPASNLKEYLAKKGK